MSSISEINRDLNVLPCLSVIGDEYLSLISEKAFARRFAKNKAIFAELDSIRGSSGHEKLIVDLAMPGMYMGENRVLLKRSADGGFTGIGVIPRCPSGKRLWRATIEIPDTGRVDFLFNVKK